MADWDRDPLGLTKVAFDLPEDVVARTMMFTEQLWTEYTDTQYQLCVRNAPFFVRGIAIDDVIRFRIDHERREFVYEELISESENSAIQITVLDRSCVTEARELLVNARCPWDTNPEDGLWAVHVPAQTDYAALRAELLRLKEAGSLDFVEAALRPGHRESAGLSKERG